MFEYGSAKHLLPKPDGIIAEAEYQSYAPASAVCCVCLVAPAQRHRMYLRIYEVRGPPIRPDNC